MNLRSGTPLGNQRDTDNGALQEIRGDVIGDVVSIALPFPTCHSEVG